MVSLHRHLLSELNFLMLVYNDLVYELLKSNGMRDVILKMSEKEFQSFFNMALENASLIGGNEDTENDEFGDVNIKRIETVNKMLKYNRRTERIAF